MIEGERESIRLAVRSFMTTLSDWISPRFPHQSAAIQQELGKPHMTTDRWNRVACILSSLHAVPGIALKSEEHDIRNLALSAVPVAQKMAASALGSTRDPDGCMDFASWRSVELLERMRK